MKLVKYIMFFVILVACEKKSSSDSIKVMSYNIHIASPPSVKPMWSHTDIKAVADVINRVKPHLVALQEVDAYTVRSGKESHQAKDLSALTGLNYHFSKALLRSEGDYGLAILCGTNILDSMSYKLPTRPESDGETRAVSVVKTMVLGKEIVFISIHLDHRSDGDRKFQLHQLLKYIDEFKNLPIILAGDFNMEPNNPLFKLLNEQFVNSVDENLFTVPSVNPDRTLDYIYLNLKANDLFNVKDYYTIDEKYASDHLPLVVELELR